MPVLVCYRCKTVPVLYYTAIKFNNVMRYGYYLDCACFFKHLKTSMATKKINNNWNTLQTLLVGGYKFNAETYIHG